MASRRWERPRHPGDEALDAETESGMRRAAVAAEIEVPGEGVFGQTVLDDPAPQEVEVVDPLAAAPPPRRNPRGR